MEENKDLGMYSLPEGDIWYGEYHTADVKFTLKAKMLAMEESPFQRMMLMHNETFGNFFTLNGFVQITERDEFVYHDMIVHPALAVNPDISRVLIIGGGDGGTAREVLRYPHIKTVDMVEIDEMVVRLCKQHIPQTACAFDNPRLNLMIGDGLDYVLKAADGSYDLILVDSTDPVGPGEGLFTLDFYNNCRRVLSENGIMVNQQEGAFYPTDIYEMRRAHAKIKATFPVAEIYGFNIPSYASGYWYFGFASKSLHPLKDQQAARWREFGLETKYYNEDIHRAAFALPSYVRERLNGGE